ncbi:unnamed protein product, partial [Staurois parvus]
MLLPGPESLMGPLYGLPLLLSPSPHSCHVPHSGLLTLLVCSILFIGCCRLRASHCCCQDPTNLPWAPVPPPHLLPSPRVLSWVPVRPPHCCCLHRHTLPCATFRFSSHCWCVPFC